MKKSLILLVLTSFAAVNIAAAGEVTVTKPYFRWLFGGFGFQHPEANFEALMSDEFRFQRELKTFSELSPSFGRVYTGCAFSSRDQLDRFAQFYDETFAKAGTTLYVVPGNMPVRPEDEDVIDAKEYARRVGENLEYLIKEKGCRSLSYFCLTNELIAASRWGWFRYGDGFGRMEYFKNWTVECAKEFARRGLDLRIIGTDVASGGDPYKMLPVQEWARNNMDEWLDAYVSHWYVYRHPADDVSMWDTYRDFFDKEVQGAISKGKRYILGEYGFCPVHGQKSVMVDDAGHAIRQPETAAEGALCKCEIALAAMNAGTYGIVSWSFVDYPDPFCCEDGSNETDHLKFEAGLTSFHPDIKYNKWGIFNWSDVDRDYSAKPELYALGYMSKLFRKNASVLSCASSDSLVRCGAVLNPDRSFSIAMVNRGEEQVMTVDCSSWAVENGINSLGKAARVYVYDSANPPFNEFNDLQDYSGLAEESGGRLTVTLPARSVVFVTTDYTDRVPSKVKGVRVKGDTLVWKETADPEHRYYRVFQDGRQIASTVATSLPLKNRKGKFRVVSIDVWGNRGE